MSDQYYAKRKYDIKKPPETERRKTEKDEKKRPVILIGSIDYTMLLVIILIVCVGIIMVFSASYMTAGTRKSTNYDMYYFLKKQIRFAIIGFCGMMLAANFSYRFIARLAFPIYILANALLVVVRLFGEEVKGARRWLELPVIGQFQPSELAKAGVIFLLAAVIARNKDILRTWRGFFLCSGIVGVSAGLILAGTNLSTALIVLIIGFGIIFIASPHIMRFVITGAAGVSALLMYLFVFAQNFRSDRIDAWLDPFSDPQGVGYQVVQSLLAIGSGGAFGLGIGQSRQKSFLPEPHNDMIFAIICEELGFVGAAMILFLFVILIWRGVKAAINAPDTFSSLTAMGIVIMIASQVIINVAVVTNSIPNTGVQMPLISAGGTSLIITMTLLGVLLHISRCSKKKD